MAGKACRRAAPKIKGAAVCGRQRQNSCTPNTMPMFTENLAGESSWYRPGASTRSREYAAFPAGHRLGLRGLPCLPGARRDKQGRSEARRLRPLQQRLACTEDIAGAHRQDQVAGCASWARAAVSPVWSSRWRRGDPLGQIAGDADVVLLTGRRKIPISCNVGTSAPDEIV